MLHMEIYFVLVFEETVWKIRVKIFAFRKKKTSTNRVTAPLKFCAEKKNQCKLISKAYYPEPFTYIYEEGFRGNISNNKCCSVFLH